MTMNPLINACLLSFYLIPFCLFAQEISSTTDENPGIIGKPQYQAWVWKKESSLVKRVGLYQVTEEAAIVAQFLDWEHTPYEKMPKMEIPLAEIQTIYLRRKGNGKKGFWIGLAAGLTTGIASGLIAGDKYEEKCVTNICGFLFNPCYNNQPQVVTTCNLVRTQTKEDRALGKGLGYGILGGLLGSAVGNLARVRISLVEPTHKEKLRKYAFY